MRRKALHLKLQWPIVGPLITVKEFPLNRGSLVPKGILDALSEYLADISSAGLGIQGRKNTAARFVLV